MRTRISIYLLSLLGVVSLLSILIGTQHISAVEEKYDSPAMSKIEELISANGEDFYAYMDLDQAQEELKPVILEARRRIIFDSSWVSDEINGRILDEDGNVIEEVPHFSEVFPEDWELPSV